LDKQKWNPGIIDRTIIRRFPSDQGSIRPRFFAGMMASVCVLLFKHRSVLSYTESLTVEIKSAISKCENHTSDGKDAAQFLESENKDIQLPRDTMHFTGAIAACVTEDNEMDV
jgi:hypothetical protein